MCANIFAIRKSAIRSEAFLNETTTQIFRSLWSDYKMLNRVDRAYCTHCLLKKADCSAHIQRNAPLAPLEDGTKNSAHDLPTEL
jgi:hypothetical protein